MIKFVQCVRRKPGLSKQEFAEHFSAYGKQVKAITAASNGQRCVLSRSLAVEQNLDIIQERGTKAPYDGMVEVWWERGNDVVAFLDNLKATASLSPMVVIDCVEASVQPSTIATLAHELPSSSAVLIWGATDKHRDLTDLASSSGQGWLRCGVEATPSDVASLIHMLLGQ